MKIVSSGRVLNSSEFYEKKKKRRRIYSVLLVFVFLAVLSSLIYFSRQERFLISEIVIPQEGVSEKEKIIELTRESLNGFYLWVFPRANALIYPRSAIKANLISKFPKFKSVSLDLNEFRTLSISVEERAPIALYCDRAPSSENNSSCFFIDSDGFIFESAPSFSSGVYFIYVTVVPIDNPLGKRFINADEFKPLPKFIETLAELGIQPSMLKISADDYSLYLPNGVEILWSRNADLALTRSDLKAFLGADAIQAQDNFLDKILFLDLRTPNKVFYKFKE